MFAPQNTSFYHRSGISSSSSILKQPNPSGIILDVSWIHWLPIPEQVNSVVEFLPVRTILEIITGCPEEADYQEILWGVMETSIPNVIIDNTDFQIVDFFIESLVAVFYNQLMEYTHTFSEDDAFYIFHSWLDVNSICLRRV